MSGHQPNAQPVKNHMNLGPFLVQFSVEISKSRLNCTVQLRVRLAFGIVVLLSKGLRDK